MARGDPVRTLRNDRSDDYFNYDLRNARIDAGYTMKKLGAEVGVSRAAICAYERMRSLPSPYVSEQISRLLGKPVGYLFPPQLREDLREIRRERRREARGPGEPGSVGNPLPLSGEPGTKYRVEAAEEVPGASREMLKEAIERQLRALSFREREVLKLRYGIGDGQTYTLQAVGDVFNLNSALFRG